jgi:hypothetical protein
VKDERPDRSGLPALQALGQRSRIKTLRKTTVPRLVAALRRGCVHVWHNKWVVGTVTGVCGTAVIAAGNDVFHGLF